MPGDLSEGFVRYASEAAPVTTVETLRKMQMSGGRPSQQMTGSAGGVAPGLTGLSQHQLLWESPTLQVIDIQRFVAEPNTPPRYYLILSDSVGLVWAIAPPGSMLEQHIDGFELEVGSCIHLGSYWVLEPESAAGDGESGGTAGDEDDVPSPTKKRVLVVMDAQVGLRLSCVGNPAMDPALFPLSHHAITPVSFTEADPMMEGGGTLGGGGALTSEPAEPISLKTLFDPATEHLPMNWVVTVVIVWKSPRPRKISRSDTGGAVDSRRRFVFECRVMDPKGTTTHAVFWASDQNLFDDIVLHHVFTLSSCFLRFDDSSTPPKPIAIQVTDRSNILLVPDQDEARNQFPARPLRNVGGLDAAFDSVWEGQRREVGTLVNIKGLVVARTPVVMTSTRFNNGQVERANVTLQDHNNPRLTSELTLWGHHAVELDQEAQVGELWCFREVKVQVFKNQRTFGTTSRTEFFVAPFESTAPPTAMGSNVPAHQPPRQHHQGSAGTLLAGGSTGSIMASSSAVAPTSSGSGGGGTSSSIIFNLEESTPKQPFCLCRIVEIKLPLFYVACTSCGRKMDQNGKCNQCNSTDSELRFLIRMILSDGVTQLRATGFTAMGECLFEMTTAEFVQCQSNEASYSTVMASCLSGVPILVKLSKGEGDAHVVDLQHVDLDDLVGDMFDALKA